MEVSQTDIHNWKHHPVTEQYFAYLQRELEYLKDTLVDTDLLLQPGVDKKIGFLVGQLEFCQSLLNMDLMELASDDVK